MQVSVPRRMRRPVDKGWGWGRSCFSSFEGGIPEQGNEMEKDFLLEIGMEEIPAVFLSKALRDLREMSLELLSSIRLNPKSLKTMGTPRRLSVMVRGLPESQGDLVQEVTGPPHSVAYDPQGNPTKALEKFCGRYGVGVQDILLVKKEKGDFACLRIVEKGRRTQDLLMERLPEWILTLPFPKTMRWGDLDIRFARPIRWIVSVLGTDPVRFTVGDVESSPLSYGHRFMSDGRPVTINDCDSYPDRLREKFVILDPEERRASILEQVRALAQEVSGRVEEETSFLDTLVYLTEYPIALRGRFDEQFLALPDEVMAASMKHHLKYFPVEKRLERGLLPYFIAVSNTVSPDMGVIQRGMERVLRARLVDARFFFEEDTRTPLAQKAESLRQLVFHKKLGTTYDKVQRIQLLTRFLGETFLPESDLPHMERAAALCKADLVTQMVGEFPELQGIMGGIYAAHSGESSDVSKAIGEHYMPVSAEGNLPETTMGSLLSLADKMDTVVGFFSIGTPVSGNRDPFGIRRRVIGILRILLDREMGFSLSCFVQKAIEILGDRVRKPSNEVVQEILEFFRQRYYYLLLAKGFPHDSIEAVLALPSDDVHDLHRRIEILHRMRSNEDFEKLILGCKRAVNLLGQAGKQFGFQASTASVSPEHLSEEVERSLFAALEREHASIKRGMDRRDYPSVLQSLIRLKDPIDRLFDQVMILVDDPEVRDKRLRLLHRVAELFEGFADFSKIKF
jgi:glycyl-tRNA synthetase beta chain